MSGTQAPATATKRLSGRPRKTGAKRQAGARRNPPALAQNGATAAPIAATAKNIRPNTWLDRTQAMLAQGTPTEIGVYFGMLAIAYPQHVAVAKAA